MQDVSKTQETNVDKIVELVNENEEILTKMRFNLTQMFVTEMAKVVMRSDSKFLFILVLCHIPFQTPILMVLFPVCNLSHSADNDMKIDRKETPLLALRLQIQLEPYGMHLDTRKFEDMISEDNDISNVLKFCASLLFANIESNQENSDDNSSVDSEVTFDFEAFCKTLEEEEAVKMSHAEKASMATVDDKYSHGSVEVARGKRMTLMPSSSKKDLRRKTIIKEVKKRQTVLKARRASAKYSKQPSSALNAMLSFGSLGSAHVIVKGTAAEC